MPRNIPNSFNQEKNEFYQSSPWIILIELQVDATQSFYLTNALQPVISNTDTYDPYLIQFETIANNSADELFKGNIKISNISRQLMAFVEADAGLTGKTLRLQLLNTANLNDTLIEEYEIQETVADSNQLVFQVVYVSLEDAEFPCSFVSRDTCRWEFGSTECGLDTTNTALFNSPPDSTCNKRKDGTFGCIFWGDREVTATLPRLHPQRYGGFPSLPRVLRV